MLSRNSAICDLLLGAAYADNAFDLREKASICVLLEKLTPGGKLTPEMAKRIETFSPKTFNMAQSVEPFTKDSLPHKRLLIELIAAVCEADDVADLAEDDYLRVVANAIGLDDAEIAHVSLSYQEFELADHLKRLQTPPPLPK